MENIMPTVFVTGANRGLGFEHVKQYAEKNWEVIACSRNPEQSNELSLLRDQYPDNLIIEKLDVTNFDEITVLSEKYKDKPIDILINNAGTLGPKGVPEAMGYQNIGHMDYEIWRDILEVNLLAPFKVATAFHDQVAMSSKKLLIMMSSDLGSVEQNNFGGLYSYRASKAGLNILSKGMSIDWKDITVIALAPGWCKTFLGGVEADVEPDVSVTEQQKMFESIEPSDSGKFLDRFGKEVPW
jgi:NAD(P)-dependent dehydrogenase (short-subunit alcohol dehydrogenase family)